MFDLILKSLFIAAVYSLFSSIMCLGTRILLALYTHSTLNLRRTSFFCILAFMVTAIIIFFAEFLYLCKLSTICLL